MRSSVWQRTVTGILGLWVIATVSGVALQACPEHGGGWLGMAAMMAELPGTAPGVVPAPDQGATAPGMPGMPGMPADMQRAHDGAPGSGQGTSHDPHQGHDHHRCTCPGACCAIGAITAPEGRLVAIPVVPAALATAAPRVERHAPIRAATDVVLPLPLGPPTLRA